MTYLRLIILSTFTIIFFGNIKADNSVTLTYNNGEMETILFSENEIHTIYEQDRLLYIFISVSSKKTPLTDIVFKYPGHYVSDLTETTKADLRFIPAVLDNTMFNSVRLEYYNISINSVKAGEGKIRFNITGFQDRKTPEIKQISATFTVPIFRKQRSYPVSWSDLQLPGVIPPLLEPIVKEKRTYKGSKLSSILLTIGEGSYRKRDEAAKILLNAGFKKSGPLWQKFLKFTHPRFNGTITLYPYDHMGRGANLISIEYD
jgi:hypothetical protein